jgi:hypothetical protein
MSRLRSRLEKLERINRQQMWAGGFLRVVPFPAELSGADEEAFFEAIYLEREGRANEFSETHRKLWRLWEDFDRRVATSECALRLVPDDYFL